MARRHLYRRDYRPRFSGHETFPLRYGWLKKVYDRVSKTEREENNKVLCWGDDAIARFGVGKNMVSSMRHWANVTGIIEEPPGKNQVKTTVFGQKLLGESGLDPYLEHPTSLWLIHWKLATEWKKKTMWFWAFNHFPVVTFERDQLIQRLQRLAKDQDWQVAHATLRNDVACFIRTYSVQTSFGKSGRDDSLESPLTELGLIKPVSKRDEFRFVRGPKSTLGEGAFVYALTEFWSGYFDAAPALSFEAIAHEPGSPGRAFLLDENDVADRLTNIEDITDGAFRWSETTGLKQVVRNSDFAIDSDNALKFIEEDYNNSRRVGAA